MRPTDVENVKQGYMEQVFHGYRFQVGCVSVVCGSYAKTKAFSRRRSKGHGCQVHNIRLVLLSLRASLDDTQRGRNTAVRVVHEPEGDDDPAIMITWLVHVTN